MTKEEAIKYLQQLYPNGGHCWLDEQRIEAIGIAINALREEPASGDFESEWKRYCGSKGGGAITMNVKDVAKHFVQWLHRQGCRSRI